MSRESLSNRFFEGVGKIGTDKMTGRPHSSGEYRSFGFRRIGALLAGATIAVLAPVVADIVTDESASEYRARVDACASELTGESVNLNISPPEEGSNVMVPADIFTEVKACQTAGGIVNQARLLIDDGRVASIDAGN